MKKFLKNVVRPVLFFGIGLLLVWLIARDFTPEQWRSIEGAFYSADYWVLLPVLVIGILSHFIRALRWKLLIEPMGYRIGTVNIFAAVMIGYLTNLAVPRMGEIARCGVLSRQERIPMNKLIGTVLAERIIDVFSLFIILLVTVFIQPAEVQHFFYINIWQKLVALLYQDHFFNIGFILAGIILLVVFISYFFRRTSWYMKLKKLLAGVKEGVLMAFRLRKRIQFLLFTFLIWLCYFLMIYVGFYCFQETAVLGIKAALSVLSTGSIGMVLTQGGLGAYQLLVEKTLQLYGIPGVYGFAFGWLSWLTQTGLVLLLGFGSLITLSFMKKGENKLALKK